MSLISPVPILIIIIISRVGILFIRKTHVAILSVVCVIRVFIEVRGLVLMIVMALMVLR